MEDIKLLNLEDTVGYLVDRAELASIGATLKGKVDNYDSLPQGTVGDVYAVGATAPFSYYAYTDNGWLDIGTWPLAGPKGVPGDRGPQGPAGPIGPKGDKGNQGIAGPAGGGVGVDRISDLNLSTGSATVTYEKTTGAALSKAGQITAAGTNYDITVNDKLPIIPGKNINIKTNTANNALVIGADIAVTSVNGKTGDVSLTIPTSTSQLVNDAEFITAEYHDNTKQDTLVSGTNIKTINNQSILGSGNITISGGGGGGGTDTGFDNVKKIESEDTNTSFNPDTGEYLISSGNSVVYYKDDTNVTIPFVQTLGIMPGDNVTFTEELVNNTNWRVKINATGGGSGSGVQQTNGFYPYGVAVVDSPTVGSTYTYADNNTTYPTGCSYFQGQMIIDPNGVIYKVTGTSMCQCVYIPTKGVTKLINQDGTNEATGTIFVGSGLNLANNILTATGGGSGGGTLYQHYVRLYLPNVYTSTDWSTPTGERTVEFSFYSTHGQFTEYDEFFNWMNSANRYIMNCDGRVYDESKITEEFSRIEVQVNMSSSPEYYLSLMRWENYTGWSPTGYIKPRDPMDTYNIVDSCYEM